MKVKVTKIAWAVLLAGMLAVPMRAQNIDDGDDPDHGVARLSLLNGDVTVQRGDTGEVVAGELNAPLVALDHVLTGSNSRAEIQFDGDNMIRLGPLSELRIGDLKVNDYFIQVAEGTTTFRVLRDTRTLVEISTPTVSVRPTEKGIYRITVRPDGATEITVRSGRADIFTPNGTETLRSGKTMEARGTADNPDFMIVSARSKDEWDRWNEDRDRDLERSQSYRYVGSDVAGAYDLDNHGRWVYDSPYGWVWVPNVSSSWAPYRVGRWSYVNYYGWTWLSGDPWGWAPYHYGRWYSSPYGWAWYPGQLGYRNYWRPALVGFFGWGNSSVSFGVGFGWGNVGWVPLAPYEIYRPWYGPRYRGGINVNNITIVNNTNITNVYRNARQFNGRDGVTSIQAGNFGRSRVNVDNYVRTSGNDLARAGHVQGAVPFNQTQDSRRYSDRNAAPAVAARVDNNRDRQFATSADRSRRNAGPSVNAGSNSRTTVPDSGVARGNQGNADRNGVTRSASPGQTAGTPSGRRFGGGDASGADRTGVTRGADIRSIDNPRGAGNAAASANDRNSRRAPQAEPSANTRGSSRGDSQPVQVNPPIVRDRGASSIPQVNTRRAAPSAPNVSPRASSPATSSAPPTTRRSAPSAPSNNGGGVTRSAPSAPAAPPAPRASSGGGGGGTIRSSGGGGGGGQRGASSASSGGARNSGGGGGDGSSGRRR